MHGVRGWKRLEVARVEKPDFLEHTGKGTGYESSTGETKKADLIPTTI
jgi:hypothetical protein